ncbi:MAG TPA: aldo/keto reductase [Methylomirabilota bacterium]|nr:aldo/keto reductase [Methylomirabilota bacterium]
MLAGHATTEGTARYAERLAGRVVAEHFRTLAGGVRVTTIGAGTYLGREDAATDVLYQRALARALERGVNVLDTAINYRHQRSERVIGSVLTAALGKRVLARDEVVVASKGGFLPFDGEVPADPGGYFQATYVRPGIVQPGDVVGSHCMTPRYLRDQLERSRANLGLQTLDIYYVHNPETQLDEIDRPELLTRLRAAFGALEELAAEGKLRLYGAATWNGLRADPGERGYLALADLVQAARDVGGADHRFRVIQLPYNLAMPEAFTRANQQVDGVFVSALEAARRLDVYVMASASVYQGQLTRALPPVVTEFLPGLSSDAQRALQFVRSTPGIGTALVGMKTLAHVEDNAATAAVAPMAWEHFKRLFSEA